PGREAREIADDAAAERDDQILAADLVRQQFITQPIEALEALKLFARRHDDRNVAQADIAQRALQPRQMQRRNMLIGHDKHALARRERADVLAREIQQPGADHHIIRAIAELNTHILAHGAANLVANARSAASTAALCGPGLDSIT